MSNQNLVLVLLVSASPDFPKTVECLSLGEYRRFQKLKKCGRGYVPTFHFHDRMYPSRCCIRSQKSNITDFHKVARHVWKVCFADQIGLIVHKDMEAKHFFEGALIFIDFKKHTCPSSRVYRRKYVQELILDWLWAALMKSYGVRSGDKDSISEPHRSHIVNLHTTATYHSLAPNCQYSRPLSTVFIRIRLFDLPPTTVFICT